VELKTRAAFAFRNALLFDVVARLVQRFAELVPRDIEKAAVFRGIVLCGFRFGGEFEGACVRWPESRSCEGFGAKEAHAESDGDLEGQRSTAPRKRRGGCRG
jgi:hypothetical protein